MAKFGAGDKRWIVDDRADGKNVHNWHWAEKDCLEWSRGRLADLLQDLTVLDGHAQGTNLMFFIKTRTVDKVEGEAYINIRKGKVIPGYELTVTISWSGEAKDESGNTLATVDGNLHLPYLADENADQDPEIKISVNTDTPYAEELRQAFLAHGKPLILERVKQYVQHMAAGGPAKDELESKVLASKDKSSKPKLPDKGVEGKQTPPPPPPAVKEGFKTILLTEKFHCRPRDIFDILMDENRWKGFTQSNAKISREVGGSFSLFDGAITGVFQDLQQDKLLVQKWRFGNWDDGVFSTVTMTFEEPEVGVTIVKLTQTNVPEEDRFGNATVVENTERGWRELIFHKIRAVFGYGI